MKKVQAIYVPKGPALEYAPLACNLFKGCPGGCRYCYAADAAVRRRQAASLEAFHAEARPRDGIIEAVTRDAERLDARGDARRILLCFTCDTYPSGGRSPHLVTRSALEALCLRRRPVAVLTKFGATATRDLDILRDMDSLAMVSLVWADDARRAEWEPGAGTVEERLAYLRAAGTMGIHTGASVEPVIDPEEALAAIYLLIEAGVEDIRVGKLSHMDPPRPVDWAAFAREVHRVLTEWRGGAPDRRSFLIKRSLAAVLGGVT